jgi:hypothetical protein
VIVPNRVERDYSHKIDELRKQALAMLGKGDKGTCFLDRIKQEKPRYIRDQLQLIIKEAEKYSELIIAQALDYCVQKELWSAVEFRNILEYLEQLSQDIDAPDIIDADAIPSEYQIKTEVRDIKAYTALYEGS